MAAAIEVSCTEPAFDNFVFSFGFTNYDTFVQVLIILNGLLFFFIFALLIVNKTKTKLLNKQTTGITSKV